MDDIREELRKSSTIEKLYNKAMTFNVSVSDAEISDFFNKNKQNYNLPETWHVCHILITPKSDQAQVVGNTRGFDAKAIQEAQDRVLRVLKRVLGGEDFRAVARDSSDDANSRHPAVTWDCFPRNKWNSRLGRLFARQCRA